MTPTGTRWLRALLVWLGIAVAETAHGILRRWLVVPAIGETAAHAVGVLVGCAIILAIAVAAIRWIGADTLRSQLQVGVLWAVLMLSFEFGLGAALGVPLAQIRADYDPRGGGLMAFGMAFLVLSPLLAARLRHAAGSHANKTRKAT
jgi:hypothetical protein